MTADKEKIKRLRTFTIETSPLDDRGSTSTLVFCTKGNNGKEALQSLLKYSSDFNWLKNRELDNMIIRVRRCQTKRS